MSGTLNGGTGNGTTGGNPPGNPIGGVSGPTGTNNSVVATPSISGTVSVAVGAMQTLSITFTSSDGNAITGFGVSGSLATLPAGWSGPPSFACASVATGSGCVLNLAYAPAAVGSGTLTLDYVFVNNASTPNTRGSVSIAFAATTHNNVVAAVSPTGQINAVVGGGSQSVTLSFTTDDGKAATDLAVTTDLAALPPGWTSSAASFACAIVSTGNGCQLPLGYAPTAAGSGILTLNYTYTDGSGAMRSGALNIPYSTSSHNDVVAVASPSGEINAVVKSGGQAVAVTFTTDDGKPAVGLYLTTDLAALPPGWSSAAKSFACGSVSTGNGCQLHLTYAPAALASGTLILNYHYTDGAGTAKTGSLNMAYAATSNDNAVATAAPTGQINAVVGGAQAVSVTFTTDDGRTATSLQLTSSLAALPTGWSSTAGTFSCSGFGSGNGCQLPLNYAPLSADSGTLNLTFNYKNNAGQAKSGTVNIAYRATTDDNVVGTPSQNPAAVFTGGSINVTVTFTTDDGNVASSLLVTSGLTTLPAGWSGVSSFLCAAVSTGNACQLNLTYAPAALASSTLSLTYSYVDNSGTAKSGSVDIPYAATVPHLYVAQLSGTLSYCMLNGDGTLASCAPTGNGLTAPTGIVFNGSSFAYVTDYDNSLVYLCNVALDGSLSGCATTGSAFQSPWQVAINGTTLYATNAVGGVTICAIAGNGILSGCAQSPATGPAAGIAVTPAFAYVGAASTTVDVCAVGVAGSLSACVGTGSGFMGLDGISLLGSYAYIANTANATVSTCTVDASTGSLSGCIASPVGTEPMDVVINGNQAYIDDVDGNVYLCAVAAGALSSCVVSDGGATFTLPIQIAIH
jgi:hypothetical protein